MRGPHDVGGLPEGEIDKEAHALTFWEKQVDGLRAAVGAKGLMNSHESRRAIESLGEDAHTTMEYYERWTAGLCRNMIDKGILTQDEVDARVAGGPGGDDPERVLPVGDGTGEEDAARDRRRKIEQRAQQLVWIRIDGEAAILVVDAAAGNPEFSTLVKAVQAAGLVDTLNGEGPFTVFAPNNAAFAKIPADTLNAILADKAKLTSILTYHVVAGKIMAADLKPGEQNVKTVEGSDAKVVVSDAGVTYAGANVIATDVDPCNGGIHVIDSVVLPPSAQ